MRAETVLYFLVWAGLIFLMMRFGCGAHIMGHGHHHGSHADDEPGATPLQTAPEKAVDPVCGMTIATAGAKTSVHDGRAYYFCSQSCREKFEAAPASYVKPAAATVPKEHHHAC